MKKLCVVATIPAVVHAFLREQIVAAAKTYEVTVICSDVDLYLLQGIPARLIFLPIKRAPSLLDDLSALIRLYAIFRREHFDIVHTHMPKTGLLGMLAAWLARVPVRINTFHGEVWITRYGWKRTLLKLLDRITAMLADRIFLVSPTQREFLIGAGMLPAAKVQVIGNGSICGVDTQRFLPDAEIRSKMRETMNIGAEQIAILFLGRLNVDKGIRELAQAFNELVDAGQDVVLVLVGSEENYPYAQVQQVCSRHSDRLRRAGFTTEPERYMAAADIFCLPSHREGFGQVIIEAAACGVPTVASWIYGITDAVEDGKTGLLFPTGNVAILAQQLRILVASPELRKLMGEDARNRAMMLFDSNKITAELMAIYAELLG